MSRDSKYGFDENTALGILNCPEDEPYRHRLNAYRSIYQSITKFERDRRFAGRRLLDTRLEELFLELSDKLDRQQRGERIHIRPPEPYVVVELFDLASMFLPTLAERMRNSGILLGQVGQDDEPLPPRRDDAYQPGNVVTATNRVYYQDAQNVHDTRINKSMLSALKKLRKMYSALIDEFITHYPTNRPLSREKIETILIRDAGSICVKECSEYTYQIDTLINYVVNSIAMYEEVTLRRAFLYIYMFISTVPDPATKKELFQRLGEESKSAKGLCTTGHYTRLLNVIQGFTDDPDLQIKVVDEDVFRVNLINGELQTLLSADPDLLLDMSETNEPYQHLLQRFVESKNNDPFVINHLVKNYRFVR